MTVLNTQGLTSVTHLPWLEDKKILSSLAQSGQLDIKGSMGTAFQYIISPSRQVYELCPETVYMHIDDKELSFTDR